MTTKAWIVTGGTFDIDRNHAQFNYHLIGTGLALAETPPPGEDVPMIAMHAYYGIIPGEGGGSFDQKQSIIMLKPELTGPSALGVCQFEDPVSAGEPGVDESSSGPNDTLHFYGGTLYISNDPIWFTYHDFPVNDEMHITFQAIDRADITEGFWTCDMLYDVRFTQPFPFNNDGLSDWRGPFFLLDSVYFWFMDAATERMSLWHNSLDTLTAEWEEVYGEDAAPAAQYYISHVVRMMTLDGRRVAISKGSHPHILYSDDDGATWTSVVMDAAFTPVEFGTVVVGDGIVALSSNSAALKLWSSADGISGWALSTPTVSATGTYRIKSTSKMFTDGLHYLVTTYLDTDGHMGPILLYGTFGAFEEVTSIPVDYESWTDNERKYSTPRIQWAFWHSARETWFVNFMANPFESVVGYDLIIEFSSDMSAVVNQWDMIAPLGGYPPIDGIQTFI